MGFWMAAARMVGGGGGRGAAARAMASGGHRPFTDRATQAGWFLDTWGGLFSRWFPSLSYMVEVTAIGTKATPHRDVVHAALSAAFGTILHKGQILANHGLKIHTWPQQNTVKVGFVVTSVSAMFLLMPIIELARSLGVHTLRKIERGIDKKIEELDPRPDIPRPPGMGKRDEEEKPPDDGGGDLADDILEVLRKAYCEVAKKYTMSGCYDEGVERVIGGKAPFMARIGEDCEPIEDDKNDGPEPFSKMIDQLWLTRDPAANPQPPAHDGLDLRTLVAQVLYDPGIRPPLPRTHEGPPVVQDELKGK